MKPTIAQKRALLNLLAGREMGYGLHGASSHGGFHHTWGSMVRAGWIDKKSALTENGRAIARAVKEAMQCT